MRYFFPTFCLAAGLCVLPSLGQAKYWVNTFSGAPSGYVIERGGKALVPAALMGLVEGDKISVRGAGEISIFEEGSKELTISKNAPFTVPAGKPPGLLDNLIDKFTTWTTAKESANVTLSTRGGPQRKKPAFFAAHPDKNLLPVPVKELFIAWQGSEDPVDLALTRGGKTIARLKKASRENLRLKGLTLTPGDYVLEITPQGSKAMPSVLKFTVVDAARLPSGLRKFSAMKIPAKAKTRLLIGRMSTGRYRKWRFYAYQLACANQFETVIKALEAGGKTVRKKVARAGTKH